MNSKVARPLFIRADAGGATGTGHVMRMIALAQEWQEQGKDISLRQRRALYQVSAGVKLLTAAASASSSIQVQNIDTPDYWD